MERNNNPTNSTGKKLKSSETKAKKITVVERKRMKIQIKKSYYECDRCRRQRRHHTVKYAHALWSICQVKFSWLSQKNKNK